MAREAPSGAVDVRIHDADEATWDTLAKVFAVKTAETATWIELVDVATGVRVTFFKVHDVELPVTEQPS
jgi:hypothetical protein